MSETETTYVPRTAEDTDATDPVNLAAALDDNPGLITPTAPQDFEANQSEPPTPETNQTETEPFEIVAADISKARREMARDAANERLNNETQGKGGVRGIVRRIGFLGERFQHILEEDELAELFARIMELPTERQSELATAAGDVAMTGARTDEAGAPEELVERTEPEEIEDLAGGLPEEPGVAKEPDEADETDDPENKAGQAGEDSDEDEDAEWEGEKLPSAAEAVLPNDMSMADTTFLYEKPGAPRYKVRHAVASTGRQSKDEEEDLIRLYLTEIGQHQLLTKEQEVILAKLIENRDAATLYLKGISDLSPTQIREFNRARREGQVANDKFINSNLRLVVSIAKKYQASGMPLLDLVQEGNLGLMHAVEKYDWRKGFKFSTYATWWIRQAITRGISNTNRTIRLPVHAGDTLARLQKARARLELKFGRAATLPELAAEVEMPMDKVTETLQFAAEPLSLSEPLREDGDATFGDIVEDRNAESPFEVAATAILPDEIKKLLSPLDERERQVIALRFGLDRGEPRTLEEVGEYFQLTRERIRQIEARAMSKLRHPTADIGARELLN